MALTGNVGQKRADRQRHARRALLPVLLTAAAARWGWTRETCATNCVSFLERALRDPNGGIALPAAVIMEMVQGEGGVIPARRSSCSGSGS